MEKTLTELGKKWGKKVAAVASGGILLGSIIEAGALDIDEESPEDTIIDAKEDVYTPVQDAGYEYDVHEDDFNTLQVFEEDETDTTMRTSASRILDEMEQEADAENSTEYSRLGC